MSSEKKTFRVPKDAYTALSKMSDDLDLNEHRCGIRALERGLSEYGYGEWSPDDAADVDHWAAGVLAEIGKALAFAGVAFLMASWTTQTEVLWFGAACLGIAALALLGEQRAAALSRMFGVPETPPWEEGEEA